MEYRRSRKIIIGDDDMEKYVEKARDGDIIEIENNTFLIPPSGDLYRTRGKFKKSLNLLSKYPITHWNKIFDPCEISIGFRPANIENLIKSITWIDKRRCYVLCEGEELFDELTICLTIILEDTPYDDRYMLSRDNMVKFHLRNCHLKVCDFDDLFESERTGNVGYDCINMRLEHEEDSFMEELGNYRRNTSDSNSEEDSGDNSFERSYESDEDTQ